MRLVGDLPRLSLGSIELGVCRIRRRLVSIVSLRRIPSARHELAASLLVRGGSDLLRTRGFDGCPRRVQRQHEIDGVETHERLAGPHSLTGIDQPFQDLAGDTEAEIALGAGPHDAGEPCHIRRQGRDGGDAHRRRHSGRWWTGDWQAEPEDCREQPRGTDGREGEPGDGPQFDRWPSVGAQVLPSGPRRPVR